VKLKTYCCSRSVLLKEGKKVGRDLNICFYVLI